MANELQLIDPASRRDLVSGRYIHVAAAAVVAENRDEGDDFDMAGMTFWRSAAGVAYSNRDEQLANRRSK